jgi:hypothetical protein
VIDIIKWISIKDSLPDTDRIVLIWDGNRILEGNYGLMFGYLPYHWSQTPGKPIYWAEYPNLPDGEEKIVRPIFEYLGTTSDQCNYATDQYPKDVGIDEVYETRWDCQICPV